MPRPAPCADWLRSPSLDVERDAKLVESQRSFNICSLLEQEVVCNCGRNRWSSGRSGMHPWLSQTKALDNSAAA